MTQTQIQMQTKSREAEIAAEILTLNEKFEQLIAKADEIQHHCSDRVVNAADIKMSPDLKLDGSPISPYAISELCGKVSLPGRYFTRLINAGQSELAAENINVWLKDDPRKFLLREYKDHIRGVLSGSYSIYDAPDILRTLAEVFDPAQFKLKGSFISEERLHLRLCETQLMNIDGEDLYAGITLDSSDIGRAGLAVNFLVWKQICTNGLVIAKESMRMFRQKHIGITHNDFAASLSEGLKKFYEIKDEICESIKMTAQVELVDSSFGADADEAIINEIQKTTNLSEESSYEVLNLVDRNYKRNRWGLINGITEIAQKFTLERRLELETIAGNMLVPVR